MSSELLNIPCFKSITEFLTALNQTTLNTIDDFHIATFSELRKDAPIEMKPYRKDFFQVNFIVKALTSKIQRNALKTSLVNNTLYFVSPEHVYSWKRAEDIKGYLIYFKKDFFNFFKLDIEEEFSSLFDLKSENILVLDSEQAKIIHEGFKKLYKNYFGDHDYRIEIIRSFLLAWLYTIKKIEAEKFDIINYISKRNSKFIQFRNLVKNRFIEEKSVNYYASQLKITPNYLNALCKKEKNKSAKAYIQDFVVDEAKNQLTFTQKSIAEIAFSLGYEEPTHFTRFFKKMTNISPKDFKKVSL